MLYHQSNDGKIRPCHAPSPQQCRCTPVAGFTGVHFTSQRDAEQAFLAATHPTMTSRTKADTRHHNITTTTPPTGDTRTAPSTTHTHPTLPTSYTHLWAAMASHDTHMYHEYVYASRHDAEHLAAAGATIGRHYQTLPAPCTSQQLSRDAIGISLAADDLSRTFGIKGNPDPFSPALAQRYAAASGHLIFWTHGCPAPFTRDRDEHTSILVAARYLSRHRPVINARLHPWMTSLHNHGIDHCILMAIEDGSTIRFDPIPTHP